MDKYEYNLKLEEIDKLVEQKDYEEAAKLADTIDWRRVRNVRTLCLVSEIYEAAGRPQDSKTLLERAYRRSPVGRTVLYRLVEVTILLHQYDEAMEYYTEYVNVAPNDTSRFILKYRILRGRGASAEELIPILEEYTAIEYTEQWAYELAKLYQQTGQMQKCLATCDDLVLWFHSGRYVLKALELKKKYAKLTPKQEEIYNEQFIRSAPEKAPEQERQPEKEDDRPTTVSSVPSDMTDLSDMEGEVIAATIIAATEKEIAGEVAAHKAELEQAEHAAQEQAEPAQPDVPEADAGDGNDEVDLQKELARSMREIIAGVVKRVEEKEEPEPEAVPKKLQSIPKTPAPEEISESDRISIDDIILSMGGKGKAPAQNPGGPVQDAAPEDIHEVVPEEPSGEDWYDSDWQPDDRKKDGAVPESGSADAPREPSQASKEPEEPSRGGKSLSANEKEEDSRKGENREDAGEKPGEGILAKKTIRVPTEKIASLHARYGVEELWGLRGGRMSIRESEAAEEESMAGLPESMDGSYVTEEASDGFDGPGAEESEAAETTDKVAGREPDSGSAKGSRAAETDSVRPAEKKEKENFADDADAQTPAEGQEPSGGSEKDAAAEDGEKPATEGGQPSSGEAETAGGAEKDTGRPKAKGPFIPGHLRDLFGGFTNIEGLEPQIANAIAQAFANSGDRTSRTGNILIFGPHGSGKTTLALNIARAVAQDRGIQTLKIAKIYAADFNRKDIAATVAKIAGGTLIIEEAGDLDANAIEQLTTAMEFRTDGMLVILEDEQQYVHDLLMAHPRFTMKFTAQIYLPVYTAQELVMFAQTYARGRDYTISDEGKEVLRQKISAVAEQGSNVSVTNVTELVNRAIRRSDRLLRRLVMGEKRYDENDYVVLYAKDFR